jgi:hypothetical protein
VAKDKDRTPRRILFGRNFMQNQLSWGSCNGYAGAGALRKAGHLRGSTKIPHLSGAILYSLINGGRDNGSMLHDGLKRVPIDGVCPEELVPASQIYPHLQPPNAKAVAKLLRGLAAFPVGTRQGFRTALAMGFPVIVAVHAGRNFQRLSQSGIASADAGRGNHAIHADDIVFVNGQECYDNANSWGFGYGQEGRVYLTWDSYAQTFGTHTFYAIASTEEKQQ